MLVPMGRTVAAVAILVLLTGGCSGRDSPPSTESESTVDNAPTTASAPTRSLTTTSAKESASTATPSRTTGATSAAPANSTRLPHVRVASGDQPGTGLQSFADDIADGDLDAVARKCWTVAPGRITGTFDRGTRVAFLAAVTRVPEGAQYGLFWPSGARTFGVTWAELRSPYACVGASGPGIPPLGTALDVEHLVRRLDGRLRGQPINLHDVEVDYPLLCDAFGEGWDGSEPDRLTRRQKDAIHQLVGKPLEAAPGTRNTWRARGTSSPLIETADPMCLWSIG